MAAPSGRTQILGLPYPIADDDVEVPRDIKALADAIDAGATFIVGEVRFIAVAVAPARWLACDGSAVQRAAYPALFAALGVTFGAGDGSTTFGLPDLRGRTPVGTGAGPGLTNRIVGTKWGVEAVLLTSLQSGQNPNAQIGAPSNLLTNWTNLHWAYASSGGVADIGLIGNMMTVTARNADQSHDNTQPSIAVPAFIYAGA